MSEKMTGKIIGIDLGTATTEAAVYEKGAVRLLKNPEGNIVTPSVVGVDERGNEVIGERAKAQYILTPERTAIEVKRQIGTDAKIRLGRLEYTPVELSAMLLRYVKRYASEALEESVTRAVISVPAYFDDWQRRAVVEAGKQAGFSVERILNEPTAAALSYGIEHLDEESYILVYDLGGGTFDVTLLEMFGGVLEVKASAGDNALGGKDFDEVLIRHLCGRFEEKYGFSLKGNLQAQARLKEQAEKCKIALSREESVEVRIPLLAEREGIPLGLEETVSREDFEAWTAELLERTHKPLLRVLKDAGITAKNLDHVLLAGGSTRMPMVARDIEEVLGMAPEAAIDPDFCVVKGTAIQAGILAGEVEEENELVMTDVCPYTLGIRATEGFNDDIMSVLIPRNTTIPVSRKQRYATNGDFQTKATIAVYQGEERLVTRNHFLGNFDVQGIPPRLANEEKIDVTFSYNLNGILGVRATVVSTGAEAEIEINMMEAGKPQERMDVSGWKQCEGASDYRSVIRRAERFLAKAGAGTESLRGELEKSVYQLKAAIIQGDFEEADDLEEEIEMLLERED
ncbi:MAG: Hsp70 family protein [Lachnospiraceae bacterium]|nr:Hsp70 family protein [Lachnospiraceae bacterium]